MLVYNRYILNKRKETMKIKVKYKPTTSKVLVYHFTGKKEINEMFDKINQRIENIKKDLRALA